MEDNSETRGNHNKEPKEPNGKGWGLQGGTNVEGNPDMPGLHGELSGFNSSNETSRGGEEWKKGVRRNPDETRKPEPISPNHGGRGGPHLKGRCVKGTKENGIQKPNNKDLVKTDP